MWLWVGGGYIGLGILLTALATFWYGFAPNGRVVDVLLEFPDKDWTTSYEGDYAWNVFLLSFCWPIVGALCMLVGFARGLRYVVLAPQRLGIKLRERREGLPKAKVAP